LSPERRARDLGLAPMIVGPRSDLLAAERERSAEALFRRGAVMDGGGVALERAQ